MSQTKNKLLGEKLKELRIAAGYTQDYVASAIGVVRQTYGHYETGIRTPSTKTLYILSGLYKISIDDLLHLGTEIDRNVYYDAPLPNESAEELNGFLDFVSAPDNRELFKKKRSKRNRYFII